MAHSLKNSDGTPKLQTLHNIWVHSCHFKNYKSTGIVLENKYNRTNPNDIAYYNSILLPLHERDLFDELTSDGPVQAIRDQSPKNILLENLSFDNIGSTAIYVHNGITSLDVNDVRISYAGTGFYFDSNRDNTVRNSCLIRVGYRKQNMKAVGSQGISLDSAARNHIGSNLFFENYMGGVLLFKNCWESSNYQEMYLDKIASGKEPPRPLAQYPRRQRAEFNTIENNVFVGSSNAVGLARRQWSPMAYDPKKPHCGDKPVMEGERSKRVGGTTVTERINIIRDYANNNIVRNNQFINVNTAIYLGDSNNLISGNSVIENKEAIDLSNKRQTAVGRFINVLPNMTRIKGSEREKYKWDGEELILPDVNMGNRVFNTTVKEECDSDTNCKYLKDKNLIEYPKFSDLQKTPISKMSIGSFIQNDVEKKANLMSLRP